MNTQNLSQPATIKFNNTKKIPFHRLPFVDTSKKRIGPMFWSLPAKGDYTGGYEIGVAMAEALLKHLRTHDDDFHCELTNIVGSMMEQFSILDGAKMKDLPVSDWSNSYICFHGQYVGFFNTVTNWIARYVKNFGHGLDQISEREIIKRAKEGLSKCDNFSCPQ